MLAKNNRQEQLRQSAMKDKRFGLKKLSVGLASVALGTILFLGQANAVSAAETDTSLADEVTEEVSEAGQEAEETLTDDVAVKETVEHQVEEDTVNTQLSVFQFDYFDSETGERTDGFYGEYATTEEASAAFQQYADAAGYTLENVQSSDKGFSATIARESDERYVNVAKERAQALISNLNDLSQEEKDNYLTRVNAGTSVKEIETIHAEAEKLANEKREANRFVKIAKDRAPKLINELNHLNNDQKANYITQVNEADSVKAIEGILETAQNQSNYQELENKTRNTVEGLFEITQQIDKELKGKGDVDQSLLEGIESKLAELREALGALQKHINLLSKDEAKEANDTVKELRMLLEQVAEKYSFEEVTPAEEAKEGAKAYIDQSFKKDLEDSRRDVYKKALDKISNDDPNYEQKVQDIMEVATAEVLVSKAEKKKHITAAEKALEVASKETAGGSLIEGKDELIKSLRERLNKVTGKTQAPSVAKDNEKEMVKEKYVTQTKSYISGLLKNKEAIASYDKIIDQVKSDDDYEEKINEILKLVVIDNLISTAKTDSSKRDKRISQAEERLKELSYEGQELPEYKKSLQKKKHELELQLDKLVVISKYVTPEKNLNEDQKKFYEGLINEIDLTENYDKKIYQILDLQSTEILLQKAKISGIGKQQKIKQAQSLLNKITDDKLQEKKAKLLKELVALKDGSNSSTGDKTNQIDKSKSPVSFASKLKEVRETQKQLLATIGKIKETNNGKLVATAEYKTLFDKFKKLVSEWENLATTTAEKNQAQGVKDLIKNFSVQ
ncbi:YSIRK-type signal peptide-containing protein [Dolosigranulum pigrum]|uniref:YSIRK-type signal peptide-containing protein n=1 Tax=Dolosigranulum pigrum TaxID=29394 RepID=UPI001AD855DD|nr:YSIRK-type signal peptide-containing protein [Dolosigranulum pigrum]QTJ52332.1 YSIRK-type signal peptide-containing protein [Dolosigranulum pigrum]